MATVCALHKEVRPIMRAAMPVKQGESGLDRLQRLGLKLLFMPLNLSLIT